MRGFRDWWYSLVSDLAKPPSGPRFRLIRGAVFPLVFCVILTFLVRITGFDLGAEEMIYRVGADSWSLGEHPFWRFIYRWGLIPSVIVVFSAILAFSLSWYRPALQKWRRVFLFLILTAAVGPGVITNGVLKEYWGRPRPREVEGLGGHNQFEPVFSRHHTSHGKSFPCGHATVGFYFLSGFFLFRRHRKGMAEGFMVIGLTSGVLLGVARMAQGGHFFSDVIWAGVICYFTPLILYYALGLDRRLVTEDRGAKAPMPRPVKIGIALVSLAMASAMLVATPYQNGQDYLIVNDYAKSGPLDVFLRFSVGDVEIVPGKEFKVLRDSAGHGVPTSGISVYYEELQRSGIANVIYAERVSGWFSEINVTTRVEVPWDRIREFKMETARASIRIDLAGVGSNPLIEVRNGEAAIVLHPHGQAVKVMSESGAARVEGSENLLSGEAGGGVYQFKVDGGFSGSIRIEDKIR